MAKDGMFHDETGHRNYPLQQMASGRIIKVEVLRDYRAYLHPKPGELKEQRVTIARSTGHVTFCSENEYAWWKTGLTAEQRMEEYNKSTKEREFDISLDKAEHIFTLLEKYFSEKQVFPIITDIGHWEITFTTDTGDAVTYKGVEGFSVDGQSISGVLREDLGLPDFRGL